MNRRLYPYDSPSSSPTKTLEWGEGTVSGRHSRRSPQIPCSQHGRNIEPLVWMRELFGGSILYHGSKQTAFRWQVGGINARRAIKLLFPFMSPYRKQQVLMKSSDVWREMDE